MNKNLNPYLFVSALAVFGSLAGCASPPQSRSEPIETSEQLQTTQELTKSEWLKALPDTLGSNLCAENELFRSCYPVSEEECQKRVQSIATTCEIQFQPAIPNVVSDAQGVQWGGEIGKCTGENLLQALDTDYPVSQSDSCQQKLNET